MATTIDRGNPAIDRLHFIEVDIQPIIVVQFVQIKLLQFF